MLERSDEEDLLDCMVQAWEFPTINAQADIQSLANFTTSTIRAWPVDGVMQDGQPVLFVSVHGQFAEGVYTSTPMFYP